MLSICALIAVRNEAPYLRVLLPMLAEQQIEVAVLDNASTDGSREICAAHMGNPVLFVERIPYRGFFSLSDQLAAKRKLAGKVRHDWVIHHDADEILEHVTPGLTLRDAIEEADKSGYNVLNFDEFVFLPEPNSDFSTQNYYKGVLRYYFFEPRTNRLNRAWKRAARLDNLSSGGHQLSGGAASMVPRNYIMRHYIVLSYEHAKRKYLDRAFDPRDLSRGWHGNRQYPTPENLALPAGSEYLVRLDTFASKDFRRDLPCSKHYWEWT